MKLSLSQFYNAKQDKLKNKKKMSVFFSSLAKWAAAIENTLTINNETSYLTKAQLNKRCTGEEFIQKF